MNRRMRTYPRLFVFLLAAFASFGCGRPSSSVSAPTSSDPNKLQVTRAESASAWKSNIVEVAEPATVKIQSGLNTGDEKPKPNEKWLLLTLELTAPAANAALPIKQIKLADESGNTRMPLSLTAKSETETPRFMYFEESFGPDLFGQSRAGQGSVDKDGKLIWMYSQDKKSNDVVLTVMKTEPQKILFLFSVPAAAKRLTLQL